MMYLFVEYFVAKVDVSERAVTTVRFIVEDKRNVT